MKTPVYVMKDDPNQFGNGHYNLTACFIKLGVHVPFVIYAHSENEYLESVGEPMACDDSCEHRPGRLEDYAGEKSFSTDHSITKIVEAAESFFRNNSV